MGEWMVFMRGTAKTALFFRLIMAQDIKAATEIGEAIASRAGDELVGIAPYAKMPVPSLSPVSYGILTTE